MLQNTKGFDFSLTGSNLARLKILAKRNSIDELPHPPPVQRLC